MELLGGFVIGMLTMVPFIIIAMSEDLDEIVDKYSDPFVIKRKIGNETIKKTYKVVEIKE